MEHNITDYKGFAVPSSTPCQKEQQKTLKVKHSTKYSQIYTIICGTIPGMMPWN